MNRFLPMQTFFPTRLILITSLLIAFTSLLQAQFGVATAFKISQDNIATDAFPNGGFYENGLEFSADYWFRLKQKRIEFFPTINFSQLKQRYDIIRASDTQLFPTTARLKEIGFQFKTNIYPFDLGTDCDCPTWGKQGPALHKGFFFQLAPGVSLLNYDLTINDSSNEPRNQNHIAFTMGAGAGIDFGISNLITITPYLHYRYFFKEAPIYTPSYDDTGLIDIIPTSYRPNALLFGLRLGIRLDKRRY